METELFGNLTGITSFTSKSTSLHRACLAHWNPEISNEPPLGYIGIWTHVFI